MKSSSSCTPLLQSYLGVRCFWRLSSSAKHIILQVLANQIYFTGVQSMGIITFVALITGSLVAMQSWAQLMLVGSQNLMGDILVSVIVRELGPLLCALIVIARSATAVASELGAMQVNKEIDALRSMSIDPLAYLVFPRLVGGIISLWAITLYFNLFAFLGGWVVVQNLRALPFDFFVQTITQSLTLTDIFSTLLKSTFSAFFIFSFSCHYGLSVRNSGHEIPIVTSEAIVKSIFWVMSFNLGISLFSFWRALQ